MKKAYFYFEQNGVKDVISNLQFNMVFLRHKILFWKPTLNFCDRIFRNCQLFRKQTPRFSTINLKTSSFFWIDHFCTFLYNFLDTYDHYLSSVHLTQQKKHFAGCLRRIITFLKEIRHILYMLLHSKNSYFMLHSLESVFEQHFRILDLPQHYVNLDPVIIVLQAFWVCRRFMDQHLYMYPYTICGFYWSLLRDVKTKYNHLDLNRWNFYIDVHMFISNSLNDPNMRRLLGFVIIRCSFCILCDQFNSSLISYLIYVQTLKNGFSFKNFRQLDIRPLSASLRCLDRHVSKKTFYKLIQFLFVSPHL